MRLIGHGKATAVRFSDAGADNGLGARFVFAAQACARPSMSHQSIKNIDLTTIRLSDHIEDWRLPLLTFGARRLPCTTPGRPVEEPASLARLVPKHLIHGCRVDCLFLVGIAIDQCGVAQQIDDARNAATRSEDRVARVRGE